MEPGFLFKAALSSVPPVQIISCRHCGQWDIQVFDVWQTNLRCSRKTFSQVHGKGIPYPELVQFRYVLREMCITLFLGQLNKFLAINHCY